MGPQDSSPAPHRRRIRILLVDDHPGVRRGLRMWLELEPDLEVAGEAAGGREAIEAAISLSPDVVLMDVAMPGIDGVAATATLHRAAPATKVIVQSIHADAPTRARALAAGAVAFLGKGTAAELLATIRHVTQTARARATPP